MCQVSLVSLGPRDRKDRLVTSVPMGHLVRKARRALLENTEPPERRVTGASQVYEVSRELTDCRVNPVYQVWWDQTVWTDATGPTDVPVHQDCLVSTANVVSQDQSEIKGPPVNLVTEVSIPWA